MATLSREELKKKFKNGALAREENFADLIDSFVNKVSDGAQAGTHEGTTSEENGCSILHGKVGIQTASPMFDLEVNGSAGMKRRVGLFWDPLVNYKQIVADGTWHPVITNLKGVNAFEITSVVQCPDGKYAMSYAAVINGFGKNMKIRPLQRCHSSWWHRLQLQWTKGAQGTYGLSIRTACAYKTKPIIYNRIMSLWT